MLLQLSVTTNCNKILLANLQPNVAEDIVGGRHVKVKVRHGKVKQVICSFVRHFPLADWEGDVAIFHPFLFLGIDALNIGDGIGDPRREVFEACFLAFTSWRLDASKNMSA
jgi:hypothetical protein